MKYNLCNNGDIEETNNECLGDRDGRKHFGEPLSEEIQYSQKFASIFGIQIFCLFLQTYSVPRASVSRDKARLVYLLVGCEAICYDMLCFRSSSNSLFQDIVDKTLSYVA